MHSEKNEISLENMIGEIEDYAILFLDTEGYIRTWNKGAEKVKGYSAEEIIGKNFRIFYTDDDRRSGKPDRLMSIAVKEGRAVDEGWRVKRNGERFWGSISITAIRDDNSMLLGFTKVTRDLTEKMLAEKALKDYSEQLKFKNKELEQFVYIASHDLQEPLQTVISVIELFESEYAKTLDVDARMYLNFINEGALRMKSLIKSLLDYSRIGQSNVVEEVDMQKLISEVEADLDSLIQTKKANLVIESLPKIKGYPVELRQLLQNLINNAVKFSKPNEAPVVKVNAERLQDEWKFNVTDNGIGIAQQYLNKIFLIFQRLHNHTEYQGNGIGLANCKKIVQLHGGVLEVESTPGVGSTFWFTIPDK